MKLRVYQSDKGDCLLVRGQAGGNILVDGGMRDAFKKHVRADLGALAAKRQSLDLVYVSHIDQDHISGVLELLDNIMAWRVYKYRQAQGAKVTPPKFPQMPEVKEIWHNAFSLVLDKNAGPVERLLAQSSLVLGLSSRPELRTMAMANHELAYSVGEAIQVSQRVSAAQLNIPLNTQFAGKLIMTRASCPVSKIGEIEISVIGPGPAELNRVREDWNEWLQKNKARIDKLKKEAEADARSIGNSVSSIEQLLATRVDELGNREAVTPPNLASIMLLLEEGTKKVLLTGDGHWQDILKGLELHKKFDSNGRLHVQVLKVQHHGSEHNYAAKMAERVTADHYIFCGNGKHQNPDLRVIDLICKSHRRVRPADTFSLWFNCSPQEAPEGQARAHMNKVKKEVEKVRAKDGKIKSSYLDRAFFDIVI